MSRQGGGAAAGTRLALAAPPLLPALPIQPQVKVHQCPGVGRLPGLPDSGELSDDSLISPTYKLVAMAPMERQVAARVGPPWGRVPTGEGCLRGTPLWDVKASLRKRRKAKWGTNILEDFF